MKIKRFSCILLIVFFSLALPTLAQRTADRPVGKTEIPDPVLEWKSVNANAKGSDGKPYIEITVGITNYNQFMDVLFARAPELPPCGDNKNASRTWLLVYNAQSKQQIYSYCALGKASDLGTLSFLVAREKLPAEIYVSLEDRAAKKTYQSNCVNTITGKSCNTSATINASNITIGKIDKVNPAQFNVLKPDLIITYIWFSDDNNRLTVRLKNNCKGKVDASFPVNLYVREGYDPKSKTVFSQAKTVNTKLPAGFSTDIEFNIAQFSKGSDIFANYVFEILLDSSNLIDESKETNNKTTFKGKTVNIFPELPCDGK
jgi:hypothetical protein